MDGRSIKYCLSSVPGFWGVFARDTLPTFEKSSPMTVIRRSCKRANAQYISLVVNTDVLAGRGKHWIAIIIRYDGHCFLFDSLGGVPHVVEIKNFCTQFGGKCTYNPRSHQLLNTNTCGAYACFVIWKVCREAVPFTDVVRLFANVIEKDDIFVFEWLKSMFGITLHHFQ